MVAAIGEVGTTYGVENGIQMTGVITAQQEHVKHRLAGLRTDTEVRPLEPVPAEKLDVEVLEIRTRVVLSEGGSRVLLDRICERQEREGAPLMAMNVAPREVDQIVMAMDQQQDRLKADLLQVMVRVAMPIEAETHRPLDVLRHESRNGRFVPTGVGEEEKN